MEEIKQKVQTFGRFMMWCNPIFVLQTSSKIDKQIIAAINRFFPKTQILLFIQQAHSENIVSNILQHGVVHAQQS